MRRKRPHFNGPTSLINKVRIPAADRALVDRLADSRQVWPAAILRDALQAYLKTTEIKAELANAQRADTPTVSETATAQHACAAPASDAAAAGEEVSD